jgi:hypothetical protein
VPLESQVAIDATRNFNMKEAKRLSLQSRNVLLLIGIMASC